MKGDLAGAPTLVPKLRLQVSRFLGRIRRRLSGGVRRFVRNPMLLIEPGTKIDESAAIAAERSVHRLRRPFYRALAGGAFDDHCHTGAALSSATSQVKWHIHFDMRGAAGRVQPIQKSDSAAMLAAADLRKQIEVGR